MKRVTGKSGFTEALMGRNGSTEEGGERLTLDTNLATLQDKETIGWETFELQQQGKLKLSSQELDEAKPNLRTLQGGNGEA